MHPLPQTQEAIKANAAGDLVIVHDALLPDVTTGTLLLRNVAVAINPADVKMTGAMASPGCTAGSDCAGIVVAIGPGVSPGRFVTGDRVCAPNLFMNPLTPRAGAFQEYVSVVADFALKVPEGMTLEEAASLGVGLATVGYALFRSLRIPSQLEIDLTPADKEKKQMPATGGGGDYVLVYGGSSATGTLAIQIIRRVGCIPIAICSPRNFALVRSYGAQEVFDYSDPACADKIRTYTGNALGYALDLYCRASSMELCYEAIGRAGGRYTTLEPYPAHLAARRKRVKAEWLLGPALVGAEVAWKDPYHIRSDPELRVFGRAWFLMVQQMLDRGEIRPHPIRVGDREGFEAVLEGVEQLGQGAVSGMKLVYRVRKHDNQEST